MLSILLCIQEPLGKLKMSEENIKLTRKWNVIKEQLIALCALNKLPKGNQEFRKLLGEGLEMKNLNSQTLNPLFYYILGIINFEERNKLIQWPLVNIKTNTRFRKGLCAMVLNMQKKYPWAHIKKLPESYFVTPHGHQSKVIDFISRLINLAIHIALDDPELLFMHSGENLTPGEINIMSSVVTKAREREEQLMQFNLVPLQEFEDVKTEICNKCIVLKQENSELEQQIKNLMKQAVSTQLVPNVKEINISDLKDAVNAKLLELNTTNNELLKYFNLSKEISHKLSALKNRSSLTSRDFGCKNLPVNLCSATSKVCGELCEFFQLLTLKNSTKEEEDEYCNKLKDLKETLLNQNAALHSFLSKVSTENNEKS